MTDVSETYLSPYFAFNVIYAFPLIVWYDSMIHLMMFDVASQNEGNIEADERDQPKYEEFKEQGEPETAEDDRDEDERLNEDIYDITPYNEKDRTMGTGPHRN